MFNSKLITVPACCLVLTPKKKTEGSPSLDGLLNIDKSELVKVGKTVQWVRCSFICLTHLLSLNLI